MARQSKSSSTGLPPGTAEYHNMRLLLESIVNGISDMIWAVDPHDYGLLTFNHSFSDDYFRERGIPMKIGDRPQDLFPEGELVERWQAFYQRALTDGPYQVDTQVFATTHVLELHFNLLNRAGKVFGISVWGRDITNRDHLEKKLARTTGMYRQLFENSGSGVLIIDQDGKYLLANKIAAANLGSTPDNVVGRSMFDFLPLDIAQAYIERNRDLIASGQRHEYEDTFHLPVGDRTFMVIDQCIQDEEGRNYAIQSSSIDISLRRQADEILRDSEEKFRHMFEYSVAPKSITQLNGEMQVNQAFCDMLGYNRAELQHCTWQELTHPDDIKLNEAAINELLSGRKETIRFTKRYIHKTGSIVWVDIGTALRRGRNGQPLYLITTINDISAARQAEDGLRKRESYLSAILENQPGLVWLKDTDGRFLAVNQSFAHSCGLRSPEELIGKTDLDIWPQELAEKYRADDIRIIQTKTSAVVEELIFDHEKMTWFETFKTPVLGEKGDVIGTTGFSRDISASRQAKVALEESEKRYRGLFEDSPVSLWEEDFSEAKQRLEVLKQSGVTDFPTYFANNPQELKACIHAIKVLDVNKATLALMKASRKDQLIGNLDKVVQVEPPPDFVEELISIADGRQEYEWDGVVVDLEGHKLNASLRWVPASAHTETLKKVMVSVLNMTDRRQEQALQQAVYEVATAAETTSSLEELYPQIHRIIASVMPAENFYIALYDQSEDLLHFPYFQNNQDAPYLNGVNPGKGATAYVLRTGKSLLATEAVHEELERRGEMILLGVRSAIWLGVPLMVEGKPIGVMAVQHYTDPEAYSEREQHMLEFVSTQVAIAISRKQAEEQLRLSEEKFRSIMNQISDMVYQTDDQGNITYVSPASELVFGYFPSEMEGHPFTDFLASTDASRTMNTFSKALATGQLSSDLELFMRRKNGSQFLGEVNGVLYRGVDHVGTIGIIRDITKRKKIEDEIRRLNANLERRVEQRTQALQEAQGQLVRQEKLATLGQLAGGVGHELRNPLGAINTSAYYLKLVLPDANEKVKQHLAMIEQEVFTASRIIGDLLDFGRVVTPDQKPVSVSELIELALKRFPPPPSVRVTRRIPADLPHIFADPLHAEQILGNLITNACQAMPAPRAGRPTSAKDDSRLSISARLKDNMLAISVRDNGSGISPENMDQLFEPLFTTKARGIGLGLAVSKKLALANNGRIEVRSVLGKGSTFTLYLPVSGILIEF